MSLRSLRRSSMWWIGSCVGIVVAVYGFGSDRAHGDEMDAEPVSLQPIDIGDVARVSVDPSTVSLSSERSIMRLVVTGHYADDEVQDLTRVAQLSTGDDSIVVIREGQLHGVGDGTTFVEVAVGGQSVRVPITTSFAGRPDRVSFRTETVAALTKQGCNSGGCHGTPSGKGGFRLSLEAYDSDLDQLTLVREAIGRRTNVIEPSSSLLLRKPLLEVAHGGGKRLHKTDPAYEVLRRWISEGCQIDSEERRCERLEILPHGPRVLHWPAHTQQVVALAHFSDGSVRDVTSLAKLSSSDETVAQVRPDGLVVGTRRGDVAVTVRYLEHLETARFTFVTPVDGFAWRETEELNYIDTLVNRKLQQLQFVTSELCTDAEFLRRVYLDVIGIPPTIDESRAFLGDDRSDKRARLIDEILDRHEYATFWALRWGDLLRLKEKNLSPEGVRKFHAWIVDAFAQNLPFDRFATELLTASGSTYTNPAANYYRALKDANLSTESTAQLFLGVRIQCAKCHNHPFERWTQDNYYGLSAFFHRVKQKAGTREGELVVWVDRAGEVTQPRTGKTMAPWLPGRGLIEDAALRDRRDVLATWLTSDANPYFARVAVNRIWAHVMGRGIVEPVDDFRASNPPANAELLDALAEEFQASGYDQKHILPHDTQQPHVSV